MIRPLMCWRLVVPVLIFCLQTLAHAGNSCVEGIVGCTHRMRKRDLTEISAKDPCRTLTDYTECLGKACASHPVTCEVQRARYELFQVMASNGHKCDVTSNMVEPAEVCSSSSASSIAASSVLLSSPSSPSIIFSSFNFRPRSSSAILFNFSSYFLVFIFSHSIVIRQSV